PTHRATFVSVDCFLPTGAIRIRFPRKPLKCKPPFAVGPVAGTGPRHCVGPPLSAVGTTTPCGIEGFALARGWAICAARPFQKYGARRQLILEKWCRAPKSLASRGLQGSSRVFKGLQSASRVWPPMRVGAGPTGSAAPVLPRGDRPVARGSAPPDDG